MYREVDVKSPNEALLAIRDLLVDNDWTILNNCTADRSIEFYIDQYGEENGVEFEATYPSGYFKFIPGGEEDIMITEKVRVPREYYDGLVLAAKKGDDFIVFRSMNGLRVLPTQDRITKIIHQNTDVDKDRLFLNNQYYGIVMTACTAYTANPSSGYWYDQPNVLCNTAEEPIGVFLPIPIVYKTNGIACKRHEGLLIKKDREFISQKLIMNYTTDPEISCIITLEGCYKRYDVEQGNCIDLTKLPKKNRDIEIRKVYKHLAFGDVQKVGAWEGGLFLSATHNSGDVKDSILYEFHGHRHYEDMTSEYYYWYGELSEYGNKLFGMSHRQSTFCRINVDGAPLRNIPVLWASAGPANNGRYFTGKILGTPIGDRAYNFPKYPHYGNIESLSETDYGRNANTLNGITVDLNLFLFIQRDPDSLMNFSQIGYVPNVYAISMRNVAPKKVYEIKYPYTGLLHQVFPHTRRRGIFGYDGIAVKQELELEGGDE